MVSNISYVFDHDKIHQTKNKDFAFCFIYIQDNVDLSTSFSEHDEIKLQSLMRHKNAKSSKVTNMK